MTSTLRPRRAALLLLVLVPALSACLDFVEPLSLALGRPTRLDVYLNISASPFAPCSAAPPAAPTPPATSGGLALVCLDAVLTVGIDSLGRTRPIANDTLYALGTPVPAAEVLGDSIRRYRAAWRIPSARLADTVFRVVYPVVQGSPFPQDGFHWYAVGQPAPDTVNLPTRGDLVLTVKLPHAAPQPLPRLQQWGLDVYGGSETVTVRGVGLPRSRFALPGALLADLPSPPFAASLRYLQLLFTDPDADVSATLYVQMTQTVDWVIRRSVPPPTTAGPG